jgi:hypothetical protein
MRLISGLWLILLGVLGASGLIIAKRPDAKEWIGKLAPYQGWIGAVSLLWGVVWLIRSIFDLGQLGYAPVAWVTWTVGALVLSTLGLLLGVSVLRSFAEGSPDAVARMDEVIAKLVPYQSRLGLASIVVGIWIFFYSL